MRVDHHDGQVHADFDLVGNAVTAGQIEQSDFGAGVEPKLGYSLAWATRHHFVGHDEVRSWAKRIVKREIGRRHAEAEVALTHRLRRPQRRRPEPLAALVRISL